MLPSSVPRYEQRFPRSYQGFCNVPHGFLRQCSQLRRAPTIPLELVRLNLFFHYLPCAGQIDWTHRLAGCKLQRSSNHLLDVFPGLHLRAISAVLRYDRLLIRHILDPMDVLCSAATHFAFLGERAEAGKDQNGRTSARGVVNRCPEPLRTYIHMNNHRLRVGSGARITVCHGECDHLRKGEDE